MSETRAISFQERAGCAGGGEGILIQEEKVGALNAQNTQSVCVSVIESVFALEGNGTRPSHRGDGYKEGEESEVSYTLNAVEQHAVAYRKAAHPRTSEEGQGYEEATVADTMNVSDTTEARTPMLVCDARGNGSGEVSPTITGDHQDRVTDYTAICVDGAPGMTLGRDRASYNQGRNAQYDFSVEEEKIGAQTAKGPGAVCTTVVRRLTPKECERLQGFPADWTLIGTPTEVTVKDYTTQFDKEKFDKIKPNIDDYIPKEKQGEWLIDETTLSSENCGFAEYDEDDDDLPEEAIESEERFDGDPDYLRYYEAMLTAYKKCLKRVCVGSHKEVYNLYIDENGKKKKCADSARYKALGNSIALPFWQWLARRISAQYETAPTLGSLFDGIGGFPLVWTRTNGVGSVKWASEIEEFCIAVTKKHFGDGTTKGDIEKYL